MKYENGYDQTLQRLQRCSAALNSAISEGKSEEQAHELAKSIWNDWANEALIKRKFLEDSRKFKVKSTTLKYDIPPSEGRHLVTAENDETAQWYADSVSYFGEELIINNFEGYLFPGEVIFRGTTISNEISFKFAYFFEKVSATYTKFEQKVDFDGAKFKSICDFEGVSFGGPARFNHVKFEDEAWFNRAKFSGPAYFSDCCFTNSARFFMTQFGNAAWFERVSFTGIVFFTRAAFNFTAAFKEAQFDENSDVNFVQTMFMEYSNFSSCRFKGYVDFSAAEAHKYFNLSGSNFQHVPKFNQASFRAAPDLDSLIYPVPSWRKGNEFEIASYRHIRRLAIQSHDHENESKAFKGEVRSRRGTIDKPWHTSFWFGIAYDALSDFGQSILRPIVLWLIVSLAGAVFYLSQSEPITSRLSVGGASVLRAMAETAAFALHRNVPCITFAPSENTNKTSLGGLGDAVAAKTNARAEALHLAFRNAFVILDGADGSYRTYGCLYGVEMYAGSNPVAYVPRIVSTASAIQKVLSGMLIFLFLLAVRNRFKIK